MNELPVKHGDAMTIVCMAAPKFDTGKLRRLMLRQPAASVQTSNAQAQ
jgi:hypothetical protein